MWGIQGPSSSLHPWTPLAVKLKAGTPFFVVPSLTRRQRCLPAALAGNGDPRLPNRNPLSPSLSTVPVAASNETFSSASAPPLHLLKLKALCVRPSPQLGLLSLLFALTMAIGAIFSLAIISIPAINTFKRLAASLDKLSHVVSAEVPSTLLSLKLSGLELNDLILQLNNLRQRFSGRQFPKTVKNNKPTSLG